MIHYLEYGFLLSAMIIVASTIGEIVLNVLVIRGLRTRHPGVHLALGSPSAWGNSWAVRRRYRSYIRKREFSGLPDPMLVGQCERLRRGRTMFYLGFAGVVLSIAARWVFYR